MNPFDRFRCPVRYDWHDPSTRCVRSLHLPSSGHMGYQSPNCCGWARWWRLPSERKP